MHQVHIQTIHSFLVNRALILIGMDTHLALQLSSKGYPTTVTSQLRCGRTGE